ncbi:ORF087 [Saltwater crocodilepox virus]|nr:virion core protein [Saltwater crocodilepox virus]AVD69422.1 virion core protein [Saltwater crocodilepox virus]QGT46526.1 ORF087 [Saltwater crocodilepox virus]QGT46742.1 ORF087 [Saltwater crocodilepox virus]QGT46958.1 ORF087 [Saltwater crocodilepox virus]
MDQAEGIILNNINAKLLKTYLMGKVNEAIDELVCKKIISKKKTSQKKYENKIPLDLINRDFVNKFNLSGYKDGILMSLIVSLIENTYFEHGRLKRSLCQELPLVPYERDILCSIDEDSPLNIDSGDVKTLANRLKLNANSFTYKNITYVLEPNKNEEIINALVKNGAIRFEQKLSVKDSYYSIDEELLRLLKERFFRLPQVKDGVASRLKLYDFFTRIVKNDDTKIYVALKDESVGMMMGVPTVYIAPFHYTKLSILSSTIYENIDKYSKKFIHEFYDKIAEYIKDKDTEKVNVSRVIETLTLPTVKIE